MFYLNIGAINVGGKINLPVKIDVLLKTNIKLVHAVIYLVFSRYSFNVLLVVRFLFG